MEEFWLELFRSAIQNIAPVVLSLATVDSESDPQVRSVILRRITDVGGLWFTSDSRSAKNAELRAHPTAAAVCWLPGTREQFRFRGPVRFVDNETERSQVWGALSGETRAMFLWPDPGMPRRTGSRFAAAAHQPSPPQTFTLLSLEPRVVEHLLLSVHPHRRRRWTMKDQWECEELNP